MAELFGKDLFGEPVEPEGRGPLAKRFIMPPFSVLDATQGAWQTRKRAWMALGIKSELGRFEEGGKNAMGSHLAKWLEKQGQASRGEEGGTSVFDPVLCELMYLWFSPKGGTILDPCAGGSVRGIVAGILERNYVGIDLRQEQVEANEVQADEIAPPVRPMWITGDGCEVDQLARDVEVDFVFTCPPYGDLEVYSNNPKDLSNMDYPAFLFRYRMLIKNAVKLLRPNRFAGIVVGDFREPGPVGAYRNFVSHTIEAFIEAGAQLYNEIIFVTPRGTLPIRITRQFNAGRKVGKTHQNVLVFVKGNPKLAAGGLEQFEVK